MAALEEMARTPSADPVEAEVTERVARIEKVTAAARSNWFWYFGVLGYAAITLMGLRDVHFFAADSSATLPILNFSVNLKVFLLFAPLLITVIYVYLHGVIEQAWTDLAELPARSGSEPISARLPVWLLLEFALYLRLWRRAGERGAPPVQPTVLGAAGAGAMALLVWLAAPVLVVWFWLASMVLHDVWLSLVLWAALMACAIAGFVSIQSVWRVMGKTS